MTFTGLNFMKLKGANDSLGCKAVWFSKQEATFNQDVTLCSSADRNISLGSNVQFYKQVTTFH